MKTAFAILLLSAWAAFAQTNSPPQPAPIPCIMIVEIVPTNGCVMVGVRMNAENCCTDKRLILWQACPYPLWSSIATNDMYGICYYLKPAFVLCDYKTNASALFRVETQEIGQSHSQPRLKP